jgi:signal recognition particle receptor subunit beta
MVLFNHATREMTAKIVYYGPGLCGKTTNLLVIFDKLDSEKRGKMLSLATKTDRTLFFDLLPVDIGKVGPFSLKIQLYTVPGQVFYNETRKLVLKGADSVVFVVDSQPSMIDSNKESFQNLLDNLHENQIDAAEIPIIIQYNKRDIPGVLSVDDLGRYLGFAHFPHCEASAIQGEGVMETFKLATKNTAKYLMAKVQGKPIKRREQVWAPPETPSELPAASTTPAPAAPFVDSLLAFPEPEEAIDTPFDVNPFESSMPFDTTTDSGGSPFPETDYEKVEEVSLSTLLEGRERPATMSGAIAVPLVEEPDPIPQAEPLGFDEPEVVEFADQVEEVEFADEVEEVEELTPLTVEEVSASSAEMDELRRQIDDLRAQQDRIQKTLARVVSELSALIKD